MKLNEKDIWKVEKKGKRSWLRIWRGTLINEFNRYDKSMVLRKKILGYLWKRSNRSL